MGRWLETGWEKKGANEIEEELTLVLDCLSKLPLTAEIIKRTRVFNLISFLIVSSWLSSLGV